MSNIEDCGSTSTESVIDGFVIEGANSVNIQKVH